jgi:peptidoglycan pentaglycine glycine transferase (the first glycine)
MQPYTIKELGETDAFDPQGICDHVSFTQADFYGGWQRQLGRTVTRFIINRGTETVAYFQMIRYPLLSKYTYLYIPYGPVTSDTSNAFFVFLKQELEKIAQAQRAVFVRLDVTPPTAQATLSTHFTKAPRATYHAAYFQPRVEWCLSLKQSEEELYNGMHEKTRYSVRTADKRETTTEIVTKDFDRHFDDFYTLMTITANRNKFHLHSKAYYKVIFDSLKEIGAFLSIASFGGQPLVIEVCIPFAGVVHHVFGCSSNEERTRMPAYAAQWAAIRYARSRGYDAYNFGGIATVELPHTGWDGLTLFKKRFGGYQVMHSDFFDVVCNPILYYAYVLRKQINTWLHR